MDVEKTGEERRKAPVLFVQHRWFLALSIQNVLFVTPAPLPCHPPPSVDRAT